MITKEKFVKYMDEYKLLADRTNQVADALTALSPDIPSCFNLLGHESLMTNMLGDLVDDKSEWVLWWILETDFGAEKSMLGVTDCNGKKRKIKNAGDLYDLIQTEQ